MESFLNCPHCPHIVAWFLAGRLSAFRWLATHKTGFRCSTYDVGLFRGWAAPVNPCGEQVGLNRLAGNQWKPKNYLFAYSRVILE